MLISFPLKKAGNEDNDYVKLINGNCWKDRRILAGLIAALCVPPHPRYFITALFPFSNILLNVTVIISVYVAFGSHTALQAHGML